MESVKIRIEIECPIEELSKLKVPESIWDLVIKSKQNEKKTEESAKSTDEALPAVDNVYRWSGENRMRPGVGLIMRQLRQADKPLSKYQIHEKSKYTLNYVESTLLQLEDAGLAEHKAEFDENGKKIHFYTLTAEGIDKFDRNEVPELLKCPRVGKTVKDCIIALLVRNKAPMSHVEIIQQTEYSGTYRAQALKILEMEGRIIREIKEDEYGIMPYYRLPKTPPEKPVQKKKDKETSDGITEVGVKPTANIPEEEQTTRTRYIGTSKRAKRSVLVLLKELKGHVSIPELLYKGKYAKSYLHKTLNILADEKLIKMETIKNIRYYSLTERGKQLLSLKA